MVIVKPSLSKKPPEVGGPSASLSPIGWLHGTTGDKNQGKRMKICPQCRTELPETARFCITCGASQEGRPSALIDSPGAIAQAGGVAAGAGGVAVGGDVQGSIYVGSAPKDQAEALRIYCRMLAASCRKLPLRGIDLEASDPASAQKQVDLAQVYVISTLRLR